MMFSVLRYSHSVLFCFALCSFYAIGPAYGQFTTILNIPPDPDIGDNESIGSKTQLNLSDGGEIGSSFVAGVPDAGDPNGTFTFVEVNISGGSVGDDFFARRGSFVFISGGSVGDEFFASSGTIVHISGGSVGIDFESNSGSVVFISGGSVDDEFDASGRVDISGGSVGDLFHANSGSEVNIFGGSVGVDFEANSGSVVNISGGSVGDEFVSRIGSVVNISGGSVGVDFEADSGSVVNISGGSVGDLFNADPGSVVNISGGSVGDLFNADSGSVVNISGGSVGNGFDASGKVDISGGEFRLDGALIGGLDDEGDMLAFNLPDGSVLSGTLADGTPFAFASLDSDNIDPNTLTLTLAAIAPVGPAVITLPSDPAPLGIRTGQTLVVDDGGTVGRNFNAGWGSTVLVTGGRLSSNFEAVGAEVTIVSGLVGTDFDAFTGSVVDISGGSVGNDFDAFSGSEVNLFGTEFVLDGIDITASLTLNDPFTITDRDMTLSGLLADGTPFSFDLNSTNVSGQDYFDLGATLFVTLILPGDFDGNLVVDGADFLKWQRGQSPDPLSASDLAAWEANYGTAPILPGDFDGNGVVDGADFLKWQRDPGVGSLADWEANYGTGGAPLSSTAAAVPEPSCLLLVATAIVALSVRLNRVWRTVAG